MELEEYRNSITGRPENFAYFGNLDLDVWGSVIGVHRDSDALERSNFAVISEDLSTRFPEDTTIERSSHWLVGWSEELKLNTDNPQALEAAYEWHQALEQYPVADEEHFSQTEMEDGAEEWESWASYDMLKTAEEYDELASLLDFDTDGNPTGWRNDQVAAEVQYAFEEQYLESGGDPRMKDLTDVLFRVAEDYRTTTRENKRKAFEEYQLRLT